MTSAVATSNMGCYLILMVLERHQYVLHAFPVSSQQVGLTAESSGAP
jgi:hypothetical protein